jgi:hypothetical protein
MFMKSVAVAPYVVISYLPAAADFISASKARTWASETVGSES